MIRFLVALLFLALVGCDTSYQMDKAPPQPTPPQKSTTCKVDFAKTCWSETIQKVMSCLGPEREGVFSFDKKFCTNDQAMLVDFANPAAMFESPYDMVNSAVQFRVLSDSKKECFRVSGSRAAFEITLSQTGEKVFFQDDGENLRFTCLDGQEVAIETKNYEGCFAKKGAEFMQTVPGIELDLWQENKSTVGWFFQFRGSSQKPVFRCRF